MKIQYSCLAALLIAMATIIACFQPSLENSLEIQVLTTKINTHIGPKSDFDQLEAELIKVKRQAYRTLEITTLSMFALMMGTLMIPPKSRKGFFVLIVSGNFLYQT